MIRLALFATLLLALPAALGCGPRYARAVVEDTGGVKVTLRSQKARGGSVERGFAHPVTISGVRLAHILAAIEVRTDDDDEERRGALPLELIYPVGEAVSRGLAKADSTQDVVVQAIERRRRLGVFTDKRLTSFVTWVEGDQLFVSFGHVDWPMPDGADEKIPEAKLGQDPQLRVLPSQALAVHGTQTAVAIWKDDRFRRPTNVRITPGGGLQRRTILLDSPTDPAPEEEEATSELPTHLSPEVLRQLADLEEERRSGSISEAEYHRRRRAILGPE